MTVQTHGHSHLYAATSHQVSDHPPTGLWEARQDHLCYRISGSLSLIFPLGAYPVPEILQLRVILEDP